MHDKLMSTSHWVVAWLRLVVLSMILSSGLVKEVMACWLPTLFNALFFCHDTGQVQESSTIGTTTCMDQLRHSRVLITQNSIHVVILVRMWFALLPLLWFWSLCSQSGITLVVVPFWWDYQLLSLQATIHHTAPHLMPHPGPGTPIPVLNTAYQKWGGCRFECIGMVSSPLTQWNQLLACVECIRNLQVQICILTSVNVLYNV